MFQTFFSALDSVQINGVLLEVMEGDARNVLCEAVEKHHASMLVVGSHGYGAIKRSATQLCRSFVLSDEFIFASWFSLIQVYSL